MYKIMDKKKLSLISFFTFFVDFISKRLIVNNFIYNVRVTIIKRVLYINYVKNKGVAFSFLSGNVLFIIIVTLFVFYIIYNYLKNRKLREIELWGYGLVIGGALGNLFDRVIYGYVIDFIDIYIINYDFPVFNVADCGIVIGILLIIIDSIMNESSDKDDNKGRRKGKN
ncbi:MAG: signal peptidase II [Bacilli bacterium]|nr:signal peptidase II [Bacilli bacterium]